MQENIELLKCQACGDEFEHGPDDPALGDNIWCELCYQEYSSELFGEYD